MFEAMAMGKPVVSIRTDGRHSPAHPEKLPGAFNGDDLDASAEVLTHLIAHADLCHHPGAAARARVAMHLSSAAMVKKVKAAYANLEWSRGLD